MGRKYSRIHRLLRILTLIQSKRGWDARSLARECGTTERTIYRDLNMLEAAGVPYYHDDAAGGYRVRRDFFMPPVELTLDEALAIISLTDQIGDAEQIPFMKPAARAVAKLRGQLPASILEALESVQPHIEMRLAASMPPEGVTDVYELIRQAIACRRTLQCVYEPAHSRTADPLGDDRNTLNLPWGDGRPSANRREQPVEQAFHFRPYCLFFSQRAWYTVGWRSDRQTLRCLKLMRFSRLEPTDTPYAIPEDFSLKRFLGKAWRMIPGGKEYQVELHFDAEFAETIADTHWHETQEIDWLEDGSMTFRCEVAGLDEIVWWVLSMGPFCTVRQPRELAERVRDLAARTARKYAGSLKKKPEGRH